MSSEPNPDKDPKDMDYREIAVKLATVCKTLPIEEADVFLWAGVACYALMKAHREANPEFPQHE
jgi:hypothetical protein